jgi:hypothetical protein
MQTGIQSRLRIRLVSGLHCERDSKQLTSSRNWQRIQLIAYKIYVSDAPHSDQLAFLEVFAQYAEVVVVYIALRWHSFHERDDILNSFPTER